MIAETVDNGLDVSSEELFNKYKNLIRFIAWKIKKRHGGDFQELFLEACSQYVEAVKSFDPTKGTKLSSHIEFSIRTNMHDILRVERGWRRHKKIAPVLFYEESSLVNRWKHKSLHELPLFEYLDELSEDARTVVKLCLETPKELMAIAEDKGGSPTNYRVTIKRWLKSVGWSHKRVRESFMEVVKALE